MGWILPHPPQQSNKKINIRTGPLNTGIDARDHAGRQPIHDAAEWGRLDVVRFLVSHGANPNARDHQGQLPVDLLRANLLQEWDRNHPRDKRLLAKHRKLEALLVK